MSSVVLPAVGLGCASLGKPEVAEAEAVGTMLAALEAGIGYFDTAPLYGCGLSERRVGAALGRAGAHAVTLSTKVGYTIDGPEGGYLPADRRRHDFSRQGIRDSLFRSFERLGVAHVALVSLHDPVERIDAAADGFAALDELRAEGHLDAIGVGTNSAATALALLERCPLDAVLIAGRVTLLDRQAVPALLPACSARGVHVIAGGVFNSGILADPQAGAARFDYAPAPARRRAAAEDLAAEAARHGVPLRAAALQFARRQAGVGTTLLGPASRRELEECLAGLALTVPETLWSELDSIAARHAL